MSLDPDGSPSRAKAPKLYFAVHFLSSNFFHKQGTFLFTNLIDDLRLEFPCQPGSENQIIIMAGGEVFEMTVLRE